LFSHLSTLATGIYFSQPVVMVTNPFVESTYTSSVVIAVGTMLLGSGLCAGLLGLVIGRLRRGIRK
jgi:hypothetical protein